MLTIPERLFILLLPVILLISCTETQENGKNLTIRGNTMGTYYAITIKHKETSAKAATLRKQIEVILNNINSDMSTYDPNSELSKLNRAENTSCLSISDSLFTLIEKSLALSKLSNGAFDITVGPLVNLWGFGAENKPEEIPTAKIINHRLEQIGYHQIALDSNNRCLYKQIPNLYIDLSAIAKGYAIDQISAYLDSIGINDYLVDIGGDLKAHSQQRPWRVAIEKPDSSASRAAERIISIKHNAVATSGNYRNFFTQQGKHYSHIINPINGKPVEHSLASVTVIDQTATMADAYATLLMVLGPKQGLAFSERHHIAAYFIVSESQQFRSFASSAFDQFITLEPH